MNLTAKQYEDRVRKILDARLEKECPTKPYELFALKKYIGASGAEHEIDISAELTVIGLRLVFLIECKRFRDRKVEIEDLLAFSGRIEDIGAHKGNRLGFPANLQENCFNRIID